MPLAQSKRTLAADSCPPCDTGRKIGAVEMALVWNLLHEDPACPSRVLLDKSAQRQVPIAVSVRHLNRLRVRWHLNRRKGRPRQAARSTPVASDRAVVQVTPRLSFVGVHLLAHWLDQHDGFAPVVARLQHAIEAYKNGHPDEDFALLHHREQTLRQRFQALFFAPLLGIETLTGFDTHEHPLRTLVGRGYHSATLTHFWATRAHQCRRGAVTCVVAGNRGSDHLCRWAYDRLLGEGADAQGEDHDARPHHGGLASPDRP